MQETHLSDRHLSGYHDGTLGPDELHWVASHLAECEACRQRWWGMDTAAAVHALRTHFEQHLTYEQVVAWVEGERETSTVEHLQYCSNCRSEIEDLLSFQPLVRDPDTNPETTQPKVVAMPRRRWQPFAAAAVVIVAAGILWWRNSQPRIEIGADGTAGGPASAEEPLRPDEQQLLQTVVAAREFPKAPVLEQLIRPRGVLLDGAGEPTTFALEGPVGTAVLDDRPEFAWTPVKSAAAYRVAVFDESFHPVAESGDVTVTRWRPERGLEPGKVYIWQVTAKVADGTVRAPLPPAPEARFQVAPAEISARIADASRRHPAQHLLLAALCAEAGALDDARRELDAASGSDAAVAAELRQSLDRIRGR